MCKSYHYQIRNIGLGEICKTSPSLIYVFLYNIPLSLSLSLSLSQTNHLKWVQNYVSDSQTRFCFIYSTYWVFTFNGAKMWHSYVWRDFSKLQLTGWEISCLIILKLQQVKKYFVRFLKLNYITIFIISIKQCIYVIINYDNWYFIGTVVHTW